MTKSTIASAPASVSAPKPLNGALKIFYKDALRVALSSPQQAAAFIRALFWLGKAARRRAAYGRWGINVPPIIIFSVTDRCNLACQGCYAQSFRPQPDGELDAVDLRRVVEEAQDLGVSFFVIAGGEPLLRPELEGIFRDFPQMIFFVFTNGLLLTDDWIETLRRRRNIVPLLSLEGDRAMTDERRGPGIYDHLQSLIGRLKKRGIFFGVSLTLTRPHFSTITAPGYTQGLVDAGCKFFLYLEYTPTVEGTEDWTLTADQRARMKDALPAWRAAHSALFIAVPWDEDDVGGCLSAGRGFVHINPRGDVEPCPFAPFSDSNLRHMSLKDALQSKFLETIRGIPALARENGEGCILWKERALVTSLLANGDRPKP
jgi:MoaA/NifB/PqqE/SkfB family radical SAM enzyme